MTVNIPLLLGKSDVFFRRGFAVISFPTICFVYGRYCSPMMIVMPNIGNRPLRQDNHQQANVREASEAAV